MHRIHRSAAAAVSPAVQRGTIAANDPTWRHRSYTLVKRLVNLTRLNGDERWRVLDAAEGLLLARGEDATTPAGCARRRARPSWSRSSAGACRRPVPGA